MSKHLNLEMVGEREDEDDIEKVINRELIYAGPCPIICSLYFNVFDKEMSNRDLLNQNTETLLHVTQCFHFFGN